MLATILGFLGVRGGIALALAIALGWCRYSASGMEEKINKLQSELDGMTAQSELFKEGLDTCIDVNARNTRAISTCRTAVGALKMESARLDALAKARQRDVDEANAIITEADRQRRARADDPSPEEMTQVLRGAMEGL